MAIEQGPRVAILSAVTTIVGVALFVCGLGWAASFPIRKGYRNIKRRLKYLVIGGGVVYVVFVICINEVMRFDDKAIGSGSSRRKVVRR